MKKLKKKTSLKLLAGANTSSRRRNALVTLWNRPDPGVELLPSGGLYLDERGLGGSSWWRTFLAENMPEEPGPLTPGGPEREKLLSAAAQNGTEHSRRRGGGAFNVVATRGPRPPPETTPTSSSWSIRSRQE